MKTKFFAVPVMDSDAVETALNQFCDQHSIVDIQRHYDSSRGIWAVCVIWLAQDGELPKDSKQSSRKPKVDYKEVLSPEDFEKFSQLRNLRSAVAEQEGIPVYNIFTNEQLAAMIQQKITSKTALQKLDGVGQTRVDKYSEPFLSQVREFYPHEASIHQP